jgi:hypothetical protein
VSNTELPELHSKKSSAASGANRAESRPRKFQPFYETVAVRLPGLASLIWKVVVSTGLGLVTLAGLFVTIGKDIFTNWLWLVSVMITISLLSLYYATDTLRRLFPHMDSRLRRRGVPFKRAKQTYYRTVRRLLRDRNFVLAGMLFGILNCAMGYLFGVPAWGWQSRLAVFTAFCVVGFICGMASWGIYGILETIKDFVRVPQLELDYSAPDKCAGMRFLGEALVKFGSVTLVMGVLIAIFIINFEWTRADNFIVRGFRWFWIAWPFALSLIVVLAPSAEISGVLSDYQVQRQDELDEQLSELRTRGKDSSLAPAERETARKDYDYFSKQREDVYSMSTWPYGIGSSVKYAGVFIANLGTLIGSSAKTIFAKLLG